MEPGRDGQKSGSVQPSPFLYQNQRSTALALRYDHNPYDRLLITFEPGKSAALNPSFLIGIVGARACS